MTIYVGRRRSTNRTGKGFSDIEVMQVWNKGTIVLMSDPKLWRRDICGKLMYFSSYGDVSSSHGWEIDHILPVSKSGSDLLSNLQPLQWENNRKKGDTFPWFCW